MINYFFLQTSINPMQWSFQLCNVILTPTWEKSHEDKNMILTNVSFPLKTSALLEVSANHFIMSIISTINTGLNEVLSSGAGWSHRLTCFQSILLKIFNWSKNEFLILQKVSLSHKMQWQYKRNYWLLQSKHCLWSYLLQTQLLHSTPGEPALCCWKQEQGIYVSIPYRRWSLHLALTSIWCYFRLQKSIKEKK